MKRQRKYRAWDVNNQKMIYDTFCITGNAQGTWRGAREWGSDDNSFQHVIRSHYDSKSKIKIPDWGDYSLVDWTDFSQFIVMDCLNPEKQPEDYIWEGDIVRVYTWKDDEEPKNNKSTDHVIVYSDDSMYPAYHLIPHYSEEINDISALEYDESVEDYEIIGNIYLHPTLIPEEYLKKYPDFLKELAEAKI